MHKRSNLSEDCEQRGRIRYLPRIAYRDDWNGRTDKENYGLSTPSNPIKAS